MAELLAMDAATTEECLDRLVEAAMLDKDQKVAKRYRLHPLRRQYSFQLLQETEEGQVYEKFCFQYLE